MTQMSSKLIFTTCRRFMSTKKQLASYAILKINRNSTQAQIKDAFLKLSKVYHPDNGETGNHGKFLRIKTAYDNICDAPLHENASKRAKNGKDGSVDLSHKAHIEYRAQTKTDIKPQQYASIYERDLFNLESLFGFTGGNNKKATRVRDYKPEEDKF